MEKISVVLIVFNEEKNIKDGPVNIRSQFTSHRLLPQYKNSVSPNLISPQTRQ
jgi:hypothetical protein